ncbi:KTSC domain-containing protein [Massilia sp. IC2-476]|uniref:KTSC domain-containing protein n=1 Tax=Massilia sp. IC2-476 TaxID=2887199 RepID=UPI001D0FA1AD|nr:KTSC domain-containing protein [Massilia sp. IC2-476]MCC2971801.1 KTSC domain-containing protein [Massilia sp. IC2-476]
MEMKKINAGKLRAIGYDARERRLRVEFDDGNAIDYDAVGTEVWRKLSSSGSPWSYYRDNIEEEFSGRRGRAGIDAEKKALDREALMKAFGGGSEPDGA